MGSPELTNVQQELDVKERPEMGGVKRKKLWDGGGVTCDAWLSVVVVVAFLRAREQSFSLRLFVVVRVMWQDPTVREKQEKKAFSVCSRSVFYTSFLERCVINMCGFVALVRA